jgi:type I restriction enzyme M protein
MGGGPAGPSARRTTEDTMVTGEFRNQIDRIWDSFWTGGISNPLEVIEQI